ncbi:hypothetical protein JOB18_034413 [Solea senegalensis]|uniref:Uncharacterized protein n=1 Tax=Solea senegalensis TaxID=28829 RepID=A0AAV6QAI8_SOLSE|nr:hypothetical protein JOB18_034413 [Solea senegalensis]
MRAASFQRARASQSFLVHAGLVAATGGSGETEEDTAIRTCTSSSVGPVSRRRAPGKMSVMSPYRETMS